MSRLIKNQILSEKDFLFNGLPCVYCDGKYILFSPYSKKAISVDNVSDKEKLKKVIIQQEGNDFFGKPSIKIKDEIREKITLITTTDCNLKCRYCSVRAGELKSFMSIRLAKRAIDEVIKPQTKRIKVIFFGGEPTINFKCITEIVDYVKQKGIESEFAISTNGIISEEIIDYLCDNKFIIQVSADGIPSIQDYQRPFPTGKMSSKILEKTIRKFVERKALFKIRETITNLNVIKMAESVKYYARLGAKYIFFEPLIAAGRAVGHETIKSPPPNVFILEFDRALNQAELEGIQIGNSLLINLLHPSTHYCDAALGGTLTITPEGIVTACTAIQNNCSNVADLMVTGEYDAKEDKFDYRLAKIRHLASHNVENIKKCNNCFAKYICSGGCIIRNIIKSGALENTNEEYCEIRKGLLKLIILRMFTNKITSTLTGNSITE